jgi:sugar (pentulose or hexulose) kinase
MKQPGWLGLDVGTSSTKAQIYATDGRTLARYRVPTAWRTGDQTADIDPLVLQAGAIEAANGAASSVPDVEVRGIGITSMGESGVLVDGAGTPVAPAIAWHDQRDRAEVRRLADDLPSFARRAGKPMRGQWSLTKHRWLTANLPSSRRAVRRFNVAEWVAVGLGAAPACDRTLACRTGWFDLFGGTWWSESLEWSTASESLMPPLVWSGEPIGSVTTGPLRGAVVTLAGHDHQAAAVGAGADGPDEEFDSCGTAEALVRAVEPNLTEDQVGLLADSGITTDLSVRRDRWSLLAGTEGGLAMQRTMRMLGVDWEQLSHLDALARAATAGSVRVTGIGTEALTFAGVSDDTGPGDVWRAVVDAATEQAVGLHNAMSAVVGAHRRIVAAGGWCSSTAVVEAKRRAWGDVQLSPIAECGTLGAAILAARAARDIGPDERLGAPCEAAL